MITVKKDGRTQVLHNDIQVAAFETNGWELVTIEKQVEGNNQDDNAEITALKAEADKLGITYHPNIGAEKLRERIDKAKSELESDEETNG
ncbi:hypothetical protein FACS1894217_13210 [Clostridia bacterium]|nr:hypothetical protein FACS1894217_13210 [Clostridia bacterium]